MTALPISTQQALRRLAAHDAWRITYPTGITVTRGRPTLRSFGVLWPNGCELRSRGNHFTAEGETLVGCAADGYEFATYTPVVAR